MPTGLTKDVGWNIGVSKTVPYTADEVWAFVMSPAGVAVWLGEGAELTDGATYETVDGTVGEVRSLHAHGRVRLTWQPADWSHETTVQVTVTGSGSKAVLRFHQERLADAAERERQRAHWAAVMTAVVARLDGGE
ncbi:SRPBCC domain-containing protein [Kribbella sandramycini]|uniref:Activator of HSP90 ATPase n=1 Tax=Kribbella sandramycini TaxID=60450 RepID=A0A7Y4NWT0_9ACTN|nr:SRPBCC domain-containing protein [Kribbella sandramycini]MBB6568711.1 activator of HSP90 ATPase [Kribbella sandramycini]NOL38706.1 SRPBCC domain-containing protein [Kribbella sandramycini]